MKIPASQNHILCARIHGFYLRQRILSFVNSLMREVAFTEKDLEKIRVKLLNSDGKVKDIESIKKRYRAVLQRSE